jgi:Planctomycete cytochrome C
MMKIISYINTAIVCFGLMYMPRLELFAQGDAPKPADAQAAEKPVSFSADVAKILQDNCVACHSAKKSEGGYRLDTFHELMQPGDSAEDPVVAKQPDKSLLMQRIVATDASVRMPPESEPLAADKIALIKNWITAGAEFDGKDPRQLLTLVVPPPQYANPPATYAPIPLTAVAFSADGTQVNWSDESATSDRGVIPSRPVLMEICWLSLAENRAEAVKSDWLILPVVR